MSSVSNTFQLAFIDMKVGLLKKVAGLPGNGMVRVEYSF
jgi:hypothetical protein